LEDVATFKSGLGVALRTDVPDFCDAIERKGEVDEANRGQLVAWLRMSTAQPLTSSWWSARARARCA